MKRLYKDSSNKMICGVCSGIAQYLNVDPTIIRLVWVLTIIFAGMGIFAYFVCAIIIPAGPDEYYNNEQYWQQQQNQNYNQNGGNYYNPDPNQQYNNQGTYYDPNQNNNNNQ